MPACQLWCHGQALYECETITPECSALVVKSDDCRGEGFGERSGTRIDLGGLVLQSNGLSRWAASGGGDKHLNLDSDRPRRSHLTVHVRRKKDEGWPTSISTLPLRTPCLYGVESYCSPTPVSFPQVQISFMGLFAQRMDRFLYC
ncbi:hypothetical protein GJAV_G00205850 [Gymnothorax javanicus]|nr:hypothetical protein GJAV_G00205850 [Gymnothorax javanicus]